MLRSTLLVSICLVLSSILGFLAQIVYVSCFGASQEMDLYFRILSVPAVITGISPIIFSSVLIPAFAKIKSNKLDLNVFINSIWKFIALFSFLFVSIGLFVTIYNIDFFVSANTSNLRSIGKHVAILIWTGSGFIILSSYLSTILHYHKRFFLVALTSLLPSLFMILMVFLFNQSLGVRSIALGFFIAFTVQFIIFFKSTDLGNDCIEFKIKEILNRRLLVRQSFLVILSLLPFTILIPIAYSLATDLEHGSISYLGYSQSFAGFLSVAVSMGISIVSFPELADKIASHIDGSHTLHKFEQKLRYVLLISMFAAGSFIVLRNPILELIYLRGSFTSESVQNLSRVLPWYLIAAIFIGGLNLLRTLFYAREDFKNIALLGLSAPLVFLILGWLLRERYSFVGIGAAYAITAGMLFFATLSFANKKDFKIANKRLLLFLFKSAISVIIVGIILTYLLSIMSEIKSQLTLISIALLVFTSLYILISKYVLKVDEISQLLYILRNKINSYFDT